MKIAVIGPQNTGKSTFIEDFLLEFENYISPVESYRDVIEKNNLKVNQIGGETSQGLIKDFILKNIKEYTKSKFENENIIFDRCMIDNYVYTKVLNDRGQVSDEFLRETYTDMLKQIHLIDIYFFIPTHISINLVADSTRDIELTYIDQVNREFISILFYLAKEFNINIKVISGDRKSRIKNAKSFL
jgi:hypothetical protein